MQGLLPLLECDLGRPWSSTAYVSDASPRGAGVCAARGARRGRRWREGWRFRERRPVAARDRAGVGKDTEPAGIAEREFVADRWAAVASGVTDVRAATDEWAREARECRPRETAAVASLPPGMSEMPEMREDLAPPPLPCCFTTARLLESRGFISVEKTRAHIAGTLPSGAPVLGAVSRSRPQRRSQVIAQRAQPCRCPYRDVDGGLRRQPPAPGAPRQRGVWGGVVLPLLALQLGFRHAGPVRTSSAEVAGRLQEEAKQTEQALGRPSSRLTDGCASAARQRAAVSTEAKRRSRAGLLEKLLVKTPSRVAYLRMLAELVNFMLGSPVFTGAPKVSMQESAIVEHLRRFLLTKIDAVVCEYLTAECFSGAEGPLGFKLLVALAWAMPGEVKRAHSLLRVRQAAVALRRLAPGHSRLPLP